MAADEKTIRRITEMEGYLDECTKTVSGLSAQLDRLEEVLDSMS